MYPWGFGNTQKLLLVLLRENREYHSLLYKSLFQSYSENKLFCLQLIMNELIAICDRFKKFVYSVGGGGGGGKPFPQNWW